MASRSRDLLRGHRSGGRDAAGCVVVQEGERAVDVVVVVERDVARRAHVLDGLAGLQQIKALGVAGTGGARAVGRLEYALLEGGVLVRACLLSAERPDVRRVVEERLPVGRLGLAQL